MTQEKVQPLNMLVFKKDALSGELAVYPMITRKGALDNYGAERSS